jgi:SGNH hydrolase-like domain, acetyltransferase AlgX
MPRPVAMMRAMLRALSSAVALAAGFACAEALAHVSPFGCGSIFDRYSAPHFTLIVSLAVTSLAFGTAAILAHRPPVASMVGKAVLAALGVLMGLGVSEFGLRAAAAAEVVADPLPSVEELIYENHPVAGSWLKSNFTFTSGVNRFTTDQHGVIKRRPEGNFAVPDGARKVMLLGSSLVEGYQIPAELNLSVRLEEQLSGKKGMPYHVLNLGKGGFSPIKYFFVFRHFQPIYRPDIVVAFLYVFNDALNDARIDLDGRIITDGDGEPLRVWPEVDLWKREVWTAWGGTVRLEVREDQSTWLRRSRIHTLLRQQVLDFCGAVYGETLAEAVAATDPPPLERRMFPPQVPIRELPYAMFKSEYSSGDLQDIQRTQRYLERLHAAVRAANARLILAIIPDKMQVSTVQPGVTTVVDSPRPQDLFKTFAAQRNIPVVDLLPAVRAFGNEVLFLEDSHFNVRGHQIVGDALARALLEIDPK